MRVSRDRLVVDSEDSAIGIRLCKGACRTHEMWVLGGILDLMSGMDSPSVDPHTQGPAKRRSMASLEWAWIGLLLDINLLPSPAIVLESFSAHAILNLLTVSAICF